MKTKAMIGAVVLLLVPGCSDDDPVFHTDSRVVDLSGSDAGGQKKDGPGRDLAADRNGLLRDKGPGKPDSSPLKPDRSAASGKECLVDLSCKTDPDCVAKGYKYCLSGQCGNCKTSADCTNPLFKGGCHATRHVCTMCQKDSDCFIGAIKAGTGKCGSVGMCMHCDSDADCKSAGPQTTRFCATLVGTDGTKQKLCMGCKSDSDCATAAYKGCDTTRGICDRCTSDAECCILTSNCGLTCNKSSGKCICTSDQQCFAVYMIKAYKCK